ncbi:hypothetical protein ABID59_006276 [Bradyrhizobium sp. S3.3.6]|uniref:hypothetical protein n=1 Tax=Bradyrhizobium sp. S3.3.6 TaxID=3156429 RepID=UPI003391E9F1
MAEYSNTNTGGPNPIADPKLVRVLSEIRELNVTEAGSAISRRGECNWTLDPLEEDDRKAIAIFALAGLQPENRFHRDLLLEVLIDFVPFAGTPPWTELEVWALLRDIHYTRRALEHLGKPSDLVSACEEVANQPGFKENQISAGTLKRRYYHGRTHFLARIHTESFVRDWPPVALSELKTVLENG